MTEETPLRSFLYALAGALAVYSAGVMSYIPKIEMHQWVMVDFAGALFWTFGLISLLQHRKDMKARKR